MRRMILLLFVILIAGCGNKMELPSETPHGFIPFDGYYIASVWNGMGCVTDMLVTQNKWIYIAEDSSTVKRYKRKGANVDGTIVARPVSELTGFLAPVYLDEGGEDHIFVIDLDSADVIFYSDRREGESYYTEKRIVPHIKMYDIYSEQVVRDWLADSWIPIDSVRTLPGRDSCDIHHHIQNVILTSVSADEQDYVYVGGVSHNFLLHIHREFDTTFVEGTNEVDYLTVAKSDTTEADSTTTWFVKKYDSSGEFQYDVVGDGSGLGYGIDIRSTTLSDKYLYFVDYANNLVKANDYEAETTGIEWLTGGETGGDLFDLEPSDITTDPLGHLYISDGGNGRVLKYNAFFGYKDLVNRNDNDNEMTAPGAIAATDSLVYVYDETDSKIILFELPEPPE